MQGFVVRWLRPPTLVRDVSGTALGCHDVTLCPWARHFGCMCLLSMRIGCLTQEWIGTWLDSDCLCVWIVPASWWKDGCMLPRDWIGIEMNKSHNQGNNCENACYSAIDGKLSVPHKYKYNNIWPVREKHCVVRIWKYFFQSASSYSGISMVAQVTQRNGLDHHKTALFRIWAVFILGLNAGGMQ